MPGVARERPRRLEARRRILGNGPRDHGIQLPCRDGCDGRERRRLLFEVRIQRGDLGLAPERRPPGDGLEQHAPERVDVGPPVDLVAADLLGRAVLDRAHELAGLGQACVDLAPLDQPEVRQVRVALAVEQDVARLDVTMHEPTGVRRVERGGDLRDDLDRAFGRQGAVPRDQLAEVLSLHVAHRDVQDTAGLAGGVDRHDVRVLGRGRGLGLVDEPPPERVVGRQLATQQLQDHLAGGRGLFGDVDRPHAALSEHGLDAVARDLGADPLVRHCVFLHPSPSVGPLSRRGTAA